MSLIDWAKLVKRGDYCEVLDDQNTVHVKFDECNQERTAENIERLNLNTLLGVTSIDRSKPSQNRRAT